MQLLILREQPQSSVIRSICQCVEIMRYGEQGPAQYIAMHCRNLFGIRGEFAQRQFQFGTKYRRAVQPDHFQHAQQTVQLGTQGFQGRLVLRWCPEI